MFDIGGVQTGAGVLLDHDNPFDPVLSLTSGAAA
jgi:hypothetical protein